MLDIQQTTEIVRLKNKTQKISILQSHNRKRKKNVQWMNLHLELLLSMGIGMGMVMEKKKNTKNLDFCPWHFPIISELKHRLVFDYHFTHQISTLLHNKIKTNTKSNRILKMKMKSSAATAPHWKPWKKILWIIHVPLFWKKSIQR